MSTSARGGGDSPIEIGQGRGWAPMVRALVSVVILWHLAAVLLAPLSMPPTILGGFLRPLFQPYLSATYLDHGYKFFAPDPGPSHLIHYELVMADGARRKGVFPNVAEHRPRLYYHRHFMLSEFVNSLPQEDGPLPTSPFDRPVEPDWTELKLSPRQQEYARSYANHLLAKTGAANVTLYLEEHGIPHPVRVAEGMPLNDSSLYRRRTLGTFSGGQR